METRLLILGAKFESVMPAKAGIQMTEAFVIPLKSGIQGLEMNPGFHRCDDKAWIPACAGMTKNESRHIRFY